MISLHKKFMEQISDFKEEEANLEDCLQISEFELEKTFHNLIYPDLHPAAPPNIEVSLKCKSFFKLNPRRSRFQKSSYISIG